MTSLDSCKVMVKDVPSDAEEKPLKAEFEKWGSVVHVFYKGPGSFWACVEFTSQRKRDDFLKDKKRHKIFNIPVSLSEFKRIPKNNPTGSQPVNGGASGQMVSSGSGGYDCCKVMVRDIPLDIDNAVLQREFLKWNDVAKIYFKGTGHYWASVEFTSQEKRDKFLSMKHKHKLLNYPLDVQEFKRPKYVQNGVSSESSSSNNYYGLDQHRVMVKDVPIDAVEGELFDEIKNWGNVVSMFYKGPGSRWASVEFDSIQSRDNFLNDPSKHKIWDQIVDVKEFKKPSAKAAVTSQLSTNSNNGYNSMQTAKLDKSAPSGDETCRVMVKDVPYDAELSQLEEEFSKWGRTCNIYYRGPGSHWATVDFFTKEERSEFLNQKEKHKVLNNVVNCMEYIVPSKQPLYHVNGGAASNQQQPLAQSNVSNFSVSNDLAGVKDNYDFASATKPKVPMLGPMGTYSRSNSESPQHNFTPVTAIIMNYLNKDIGVLRTQEHGNGLFHVSSAFFCNMHRTTCRDVGCNFYARCRGEAHIDISGLLPIGTQVNILLAPLNVQGPCLYEFQASLLWPASSIKPLEGGPLPVEKLIANASYFMFILNQQQTESVNKRAISKPLSASNSFAENSNGFYNDDDSDSILTTSHGTASVVSGSENNESDYQVERNNETVIRNITTLVDFFSDQFKLDGRDNKILGLQGLAFNILQIIGNTDSSRSLEDNKLEIQCVKYVYSFIKEKKINLETDKIKNLIAMFNPLIHTLTHQKKSGVINADSLKNAQDFIQGKISSSTNHINLENDFHSNGTVVHDNNTERIELLEAKVEALEKSASGMDKKVEALETDNLKLKSSMGKLLDHIKLMTEEMRNLKLESDTRKAREQQEDRKMVLHLQQQAEDQKEEKKRQVVKICQENGGETYELMTNDSGQLSVDSVKAIFTGVNALKYKSDGGAFRICNLVGGIFESPVDGWGSRVYIANVPRTSNGMLPAVAATSSASPAPIPTPSINDMFAGPNLNYYPAFQNQYSMQALKSSMFSPSMLQNSNPNFPK